MARRHGADEARGVAGDTLAGSQRWMAFVSFPETEDWPH